MPAPGVDRLIFPLDVPGLEEAEGWVERLADRVGSFKVGLELFTAAGPTAVRRIVERGHDVFLDLKLHDIPATVERAARAAARLGARMLTVHAPGGAEMLAAAARGAGPDVVVLVVTRLTSLPAREEEVVAAAGLARETGCGGVVCSGSEARAVRLTLGPDLRIVCPGIRPAGAARDDQQRVVTAGDAIAAGADFVVVGRPIRDASAPAEVAGELAQEIVEALARR